MDFFGQTLISEWYFREKLCNSKGVNQTQSSIFVVQEAIEQQRFKEKRITFIAEILEHRDTAEISLMGQSGWKKTPISQSVRPL